MTCLQPPTLFCFAVKEEAGPFRKRAGSQPNVQVLLTGIGERKAETALRKALAAQRPGLVLSCGFAGGLEPRLPGGTIVFDAEGEAGLEACLQAAGARRVRFHCSPRIAASAAEKFALWRATGADAVEMESRVIRAVCRQEGIRCATVRVILDTANEDLPLDFNRLMTPTQQMDYAKLALALARSPGKVPALLRLQKQSEAAATKLGEVLAMILTLSPGCIS